MTARILDLVVCDVASISPVPPVATVILWAIVVHIPVVFAEVELVATNVLSLTVVWPAVKVALLSEGKVSEC